MTGFLKNQSSYEVLHAQGLSSPYVSFVFVLEKHVFQSFFFGQNTRILPYPELLPEVVAFFIFSVSHHASCAMAPKTPQTTLTSAARAREIVHGQWWRIPREAKKKKKKKTV